MLVPLSTLLTRGKRRKHALLSCRFSYLPIAIAAVRAADAHDEPLVLTLDATQPLSHSLEFVLSTVLTLARMAKVEMSVETLLEPRRELIDEAFDAGALAVTPLAQECSMEQLVALLSWAHKRATAYGAETVAHTAIPRDLSTIVSLVESTGVQAARITFHKHTTNGLEIVPQDITEVAKYSKVPIIAEECDCTPEQMRKFFAAGAAALTLGSHFEESYTGGLRTGLRNRAVTRPASYTKPALLAVEQNVANIIQHLHKK